MKTLDAEPVDTRLGRGWNDIARRDAERREWLDARARETAATGRKGCRIEDALAAWDAALSPKPTEAPREKPCANDEDCDHTPCCFDNANPTPPENPLRAENERLREALKHIEMELAEHPDIGAANIVTACLGHARAALKGTP